MKNKFLLLSSTLFLFCFEPSFGQAFFNGDFENNNSTDCDYNLSDSEFNTRISHVFAFGKTFYAGGYTGETDIQTTGCYVNPQSRNWCIGIANDYTIFTTSDAIAIELTSNLSVGQSYQLSFYLFGNNSFSSNLARVRVGESVNNSTFGVIIDSIVPTAMVWKEVVFNFIASQPSKYITVTNVPGMNAWNQVDNFAIKAISGVNSVVNESLKIKVFPNPTSDFVSIQTDDSSKFVSATIKTLLGETIFTTNSTTIDFTHLLSGFYLIEIKTDKGYFTTRLLRQ